MIDTFSVRETFHRWIHNMQDDYASNNRRAIEIGKDSFSNDPLQEMRRLIKEHNIQANKFMEHELAKVFIDIIKSGDLLKYTVLNTEKFAFVYIPFREKQELQNKIERLQEHIDKMSCCCSGCTKHNQDLKG